MPLAGVGDLTTNGANNGEKPLPEESLSEFVDDINSVLDRRDLLIEYFDDLYLRKSKENTQPELNSFLEDEREIAKLYLVHKNQEYSLKKTLSVAVEKDMITEDEMAGFLSLWDEIIWASDAIRAFYLESEFTYRYWTERTMDVERRNDDYLIEHSLMWGLDEVHTIRIPLHSVFEDSTDRMRTVMSWIKSEDSEEVLTEELIGQLEQSSKKLTDLAEEMDEVIAGAKEQESQEKTGENNGPAD